MVDLINQFVVLTNDKPPSINTLQSENIAWVVEETSIL